MLLVNADRFPDETREVLAGIDPDEVVVVGREGSVNAAVVDAIVADGHTVRRIAGNTRYHTAALVHAESVDAGMDAAQLWLATGRAFPDALAAGPTLAALGHSFALVDGHDLTGSPETIAPLEAAGLQRVTLVGGHAAINANVEDQIRDLVGAGR